MRGARLRARCRARGRDEPEAAADRGRAGPHVLQALPGGDLLFVEARAVVDDGHEPLARRARRSHPARRAPACLRAFASPSWTIRKTSICSSGASRMPSSISRSTSSCPSAVRKSTYRRSAESNGRRAAGRGEREHREARLLLRCGRRLLQPGQRLRRVGAALEHARVRRDREQVLREAVVDLARDARALLGDGAAELGEADRPPDADEQDAVGEQAQEVALGDVAARERAA